MNMRFLLSVGACFAGGLTLAALVSGCGAKPNQARQPAESIPAVNVGVQPLSTQAREEYEEVVGTVRARLRATLESRVAGQIVELPVSLGQQVKAGDLIARLSAPEIQARLDSAKAGVDLAEKEWKRSSSLFEQQATTRVEYEAAEARRSLALAALTEAKTMLGYMEIVAPFSGRITRKYVDRGDLANPGKPLVDLDDPATLEIEAFVPENLASSLEIGTSLSVQSKEGSKNLRAKVSELAPAADPVTRTLLVRAEFPVSTELGSGQFVRLLMPSGKQEYLRVPVSAVVHRGQLDVIYTVKEKKARMHLVRLGRISGGQVEVLSGLPAAGEVVITGAGELTDGQPVNVE